VKANNETAFNYFKKSADKVCNNDLLPSVTLLHFTARYINQKLSKYHILAHRWYFDSLWKSEKCNFVRWVCMCKWLY